MKDRPFLPAVLLLALSLLWLRLEDITLFSVDGVVYADVAKELAKKPFPHWAAVTWLDGTPYLEHPPLMKWVLGLFIRLLGPTSLAAVLPSVIFATLTVLVTFLAARALVSPTFALLTGLILCLTPGYIRDSRNPMLEPPLTFFIMTAMWSGVTAIRAQRFFWSFGSGLSIALGILTKGPAALIVLPALAFYAYWQKIERKWLGRSMLLLLAGALVPLFLFEIWHRSVTSVFFFPQYWKAQIIPAISTTTPQSKDLFFYARDALTRHWPWLALAIVSPFVVMRSERRDLKGAWAMSLILWLGPLIAFSFGQKKSTWYANITFPGLAMLAASSTTLWIERQRLERRLTHLALILSLILLFLGATVPSLFRYKRPIEDFFHQLSQSPHAGALKDQNIADCIGLDPWKGSHFTSYYLGARLVPCESPLARFRITRVPKKLTLFQTEGLVLIEEASR